LAAAISLVPLLPFRRNVSAGLHDDGIQGRLQPRACGQNEGVVFVGLVRLEQHLHHLYRANGDLGYTRAARVVQAPCADAVVGQHHSRR